MRLIKRLKGLSRLKKLLNDYLHNHSKIDIKVPSLCGRKEFEGIIINFMI
jgi:hypothetical protein